MKKIDLLINASILSEKNTGLGVYTYQLLNSLATELDNRRISYEVMCLNKDYLPPICRDKFIKVSFKGFFSRTIATSMKYSNRYNLVLSTTHHGGIFSRTKQIITVHDLIPVFYPDGRRYQTIYYNYIMPTLLKESELVFTVSNSTKNDILKKYNISENKIKVVYEGVNKLEYTAKQDEKDVLRRYGINNVRYLSVTGIHYSYKNIQSIIEMFANYPDIREFKVVIIGNDKCQYADYLKQLIHDKELGDVFVFTGFVSDQEKIAIIQNSFACVYPSLYEGFGIPVIEAMNLGVPVLCSNMSSLPEVGLDSAIYFDPLDINSMYEALKKIKSEDLRRDLIKKGYLNAARFNWNDIANIMANYIENILVKQRGQ